MSASTTTSSPMVRLMGKRPASMAGCIPSIITRLRPASGCIQPPLLVPSKQTSCQVDRENSGERWPTHLSHARPPAPPLEWARALHLCNRFPCDSGRHGFLLRPETGDKCIRTQNVQGSRDALGCLDNACQCPGGEDGFSLGGSLCQAVVNVGSALL